MDSAVKSEKRNLTHGGECAGRHKGTKVGVKTRTERKLEEFEKCPVKEVQIYQKCSSFCLPLSILRKVLICMSHHYCHHLWMVKWKKECLSACLHITNLVGKSDQHFSQAALLEHIYYIYYIYSWLFCGHMTYAMAKSHFESRWAASEMSIALCSAHPPREKKKERKQ